MSSAATIDTGANNIVLSGAISGTAALTKNGAGTLTLSANNTVSRSLTVNNGTLGLAGVWQDITLANNTTLRAEGDVVVNRSGAPSTIMIGTFNSNATIDTNGHNITVAAGAGSSNATISINGTFTKTGEGTLTLATGVGTLSGAGYALINQGTLAIGGAIGNGGYLLAGGTLKVNAPLSFLLSSTAVGGTLDTNGYDTTLSTFSSNQIVTKSGSGNLTVTGSGSGILAMGDSGALTKSGTGIVTLVGSPAYAGGTTINAGLIQFTSIANFGSGNIVLNGGGVQWASGTTTDISSRLSASGSGGTFDTNGNDVTLATAFSGALTKTGTGTLTLSAVNVTSRNATISGGTLAIAGTWHDIVMNGTNPVLRAAGDLTVNRSSAVSSIYAFGTPINATIDTNGYNINLTSGAGNNGTVTLNGTLTKIGAGTLTLATGVGNMNGGTTVISEGTLAMSNTYSSDTSAPLNRFRLDGGTLQANAAFTVTANATANGGTIDTNGYNILLNGAATAASQTFLGPVVKTGTGNLTIGGNQTFSGGLTVTAGNLVLTGSSGGNIISNTDALLSGTFTFTGNISGTGNVIKSDAGTVTISGNLSHAGTTTLNAGTLVVSADSSLGGAGAPIVFGGGTLQASGAFSTTRNVTLSGGGTLNLAGALELPGVVSGTGALTKTGSGALTLTANNSYSGGTNVNAGLVEFTFAENFGTGNIALNGGGLRWAGASTVDISSRLAAVGASGGVFDTNGSNVTFASTLTGTGGLTKNGIGSLTLATATTFTGATTVNAGTLTLGHSLALQSSTVTAPAAGLFSFGSLTSATLGGLSGANALALTNSASAPVGLTVGANGGSTTFSGVLSGAGSLAKTGAGTLVLSGATTYAGGTTVTGGLLEFATLAHLGSGNVTLDGGGLRWATGSTVDISPRLAALGSGGATFNTNANNVTLATSLSGSGGLAKTGTGTLTLTAANTFAGATSVAAGTLTLGHALALQNSTVTTPSSGSLSFGSLSNATVGGLSGSANLALANATSGAVALTLGGNEGSTAYSGVLSGSGRLIKIGNGTLTLYGSNTFAGGTTISAGTIALAGSGTLGNTGAIAIDANGSLDLGASTLDYTRLSGAGQVIQTAPYSFTSSSGLALTNRLTGSASLAQSGTGTLTLSGANTYSGGTMLSAGTLGLAHDSALGSGTLALQGGTILATNAARTLANAVTVNGPATFGGTHALAFTGPVTLNGFNGLTFANSAATTFGGAIGESTPSILIKQGMGELQLTGASTYTGGTFIQSGTVRINNASGSAFGTGAVTVPSGATLTGAGSFSGALQLNGNFSPGNSPGTVSTGSETWAPGSSLLWEINNATGTAGSSWDLLNISGSLTLAATSANKFTINLASLTLANAAGLAANFNPASNYTFSFVTVSGGISGLDINAIALNTSGFQNPFSGTWSLAASANSLSLNYTASAIPEPSTYAACAGAAALALAAFRRRRSA